MKKKCNATQGEDEINTFNKKWRILGQHKTGPLTGRSVYGQLVLQKLET